MASISRPPFIAKIVTQVGDVSREWMSWFQEIQRNSTEGTVQLNNQSISSDSSITITDVLTSDYEHYRVVFEDVSVATDGAIIRLRVSEDNGSTYKSGASDYDWNLSSTALGNVSLTFDAADSEIELMEDGIENTSADGRVCGHIDIYTPSSTTHKKTFMWELTYENTSGELVRINGAGRYLSSNAIDALQIAADSGNLASGRIKLYGIR